MKKLKDFENELNKCSKCGLCQSVCPVFKIYPNDCAVSKGKFIMLQGVTRGDLEFSENINKYLDMCLKCGKCTNYCPSGINACAIVNTAKYECVKGKFSTKIIQILESRYVFSGLISFFKTITKCFRPKKQKVKINAQKLLYFKGCVNNILPNTDKYIQKICSNLDIEIIEPDFECCGLPFLSNGNMERFIEVAKYNIEIIKNTDFDYIITDCASCESTLSEYPQYIENVEFDGLKFINWGDLISDKNLKFKYNKPLKVTFHRPCHLKNDDFAERIFSNCQNIEYIKMDNYDDCCGLAGSFALKNPKLSEELSRLKAENIKKANVDYVITTCPACIIGLKKGLLSNKSKIKVVSLLEFLSMAEEIY